MIAWFVYAWRYSDKKMRYFRARKKNYTEKGRSRFINVYIDNNLVKRCSSVRVCIIDSQDPENIVECKILVLSVACLDHEHSVRTENAERTKRKRRKRIIESKDRVWIGVKRRVHRVNGRPCIQTADVQ